MKANSRDPEQVPPLVVLNPVYNPLHCLIRGEGALNIKMTRDEKDPGTPTPFQT